MKMVVISLHSVGFNLAICVEVGTFLVQKVRWINYMTDLYVLVGFRSSVKASVMITCWYILLIVEDVNFNS